MFNIVSAVPGAGMIAVAVAAVLLWQKGKPPLWRATGLGALAWVISVALKAGWAISTNAFVFGSATRVLGEAAAGVFMWIYIGLLTGIFECGVVHLFAKRTRLKTADWDQAVAFGLGYGAVEAIVLGIAAIVQAFAMNEAVTGTVVLAIPIVERILALGIHTFTCVLIVYSAQTGKARWFWVAFAYKTLVDALAAWGILAFGVRESTSRLVQFEILLAAIAIPAFIVLSRFGARFRSTEGPTRLHASQ